MFATKEDQRLYLVPWEYNSMRVLGCLAKIVQDNGGDVEPWRHCMANNRTYEPTAEPKRIFGQSWINFILDNMYYHISLNDNPFLDMTIIKTPVIDGNRYLRNVYARVLDRDLMYDCLFRVTNDEEAKEIANQLFNIALQAKTADRYYRTKHIQVPNTYDDGWHWENKPEPDEWIEAKWKLY